MIRMPIPSRDSSKSKAAKGENTFVDNRPSTILQRQIANSIAENPAPNRFTTPVQRQIEDDTATLSDGDINGWGPSIVKHFAEKAFNDATQNHKIDMDDLKKWFPIQIGNIRSALGTFASIFAKNNSPTTAIIRNAITVFINTVNPELQEIENKVDVYFDIQNSPMMNVVVGNEFTFSNDKMSAAVDTAVESGNADSFYKEMSQHFKAARNLWETEIKSIVHAQDVTVTTADYQYAEGQPDGLAIDIKDSKTGTTWGYKVTMDDGVVEIITDPARGGDIMQGEVGAWMDKYIFGVANACKLSAHATLGGGHINLDRTTAFSGNDTNNDNLAALKLRNFFVQFIKDAAYWKDQDPDVVNAPFPDEVGDGKEGGKGMEKVIADFDAAQKTKENKWTLNQLANKLMVKYKELPSKVPNVEKKGKPHYQALNVEHLQNEGKANRLEVRRVSAQKDRFRLLQDLQKIGEILKIAESSAAAKKVISIL